MSLAAIAVALIPSSAGAQARTEPLEMMPESDWVVDHAEDSCGLRRVFVAGDDRIGLALRQFGPGDEIEFTLVSNTLSPAHKAPRVRYEPDDEFFAPVAPFYLDNGTAYGVRYVDNLRPTALKPAGLPSDWPRAERELRERSITALSLSRIFERSLVLKTGPMDGPMETLRTCLDELVRRWGLDPAQQRTLSRLARPVDLPGWARRVQAGYPPQMLRAGRSAMVPIRLLVGTEGRPTACLPHKISANAVFEEHACGALMRYARFEPALDAGGQPIASAYTTTVTYQVN